MAVPHGLLEATIMWPVGEIVSEVPFPKHAGAIARRCKNIGKGDLVPPQEGPPGPRPPGPGANGVAPGQQCRPGRRADRVDMEIREANAFV